MIGARLGAFAGAAVLLVGCGGDEPGSGAPISLTERLMPGADTYAAVDLAGLREELELPEDANPRIAVETDPGLSFNLLADRALTGLSAPQDSRVETALELGLATGVATAQTGSGKRIDFTTALATAADTGVIGSALGDLGFEDRGGVLERNPDDDLAFRVEDGLILFSTDPALLRELPPEPADDPPAPLLDEIEGASVNVQRGFTCLDGLGVASNADGTGELGLLVDGEARPGRVELEDSDEVTAGEPDVDGSLVKVDFETADAVARSPLDFLNLLLPGYDCG